ncbi:pol polyprotein, partial [Vairimorpha apis BRL 01]
KTYNNNKIFNNKQKSICSRGSILEEFFSSGRLPAANATKAKSVRAYKTQKKFVEVFHRNMQKASPLKIFDYLKDLEEGILLQGNGIYMVNDNNALYEKVGSKAINHNEKRTKLLLYMTGLMKTIFAKPQKMLNFNEYSACEITNIKVKEKIEIGKDEFIVEFYVLKRLPVAVIIGLSFLEGNYCNKTFNHEIFNQKLNEILNNSSTISNDELNKILKFYTSVNNNFKRLPSTCKILPTKKRLKKLLKEDIIEKSNSNFTNPTFFKRRKIAILKFKWEAANILKYTTTFMLLRNQYQYKRVSFGIKLRPKICQWYISEILYDIYNCFVYIDGTECTKFNPIKHINIVIYTKSKEEHINELDVLGYKIDKEGIYHKTKKVRTKKDKIYSESIHKNERRYILSPIAQKIVLECDALDIGLGLVLRTHYSIETMLRFIRISVIDCSIIKEQHPELLDGNSDTLSRCLQIELKKEDNYKRLILKNCLTCYKSKATMRILKDIHKVLDHRGVTTIAKIHNLKNNKEYHIVAKENGERISMDIYGPFETSDFKNGDVNEKEYILSITDVYSRIAISDNGKQFDNIDIRNYYNSKDIKQILVPEYTLSSNKKEVEDTLNKTTTEPYSNLHKQYFLGNNTKNTLYKYQHSLQKIIKVGKRRYWVMLEFDNGWTHVRNIRLIMRCSMISYPRRDYPYIKILSTNKLNFIYSYILNTGHSHGNSKRKILNKHYAESDYIELEKHIPGTECELISMGSKEKNFQHSEIEQNGVGYTKIIIATPLKIDEYVNEITTKNMIIKAFNEEKGQNIIDEVEKYKLNKNDKRSNKDIKNDKHKKCAGFDIRVFNMNNIHKTKDKKEYIANGIENVENNNDNIKPYHILSKTYDNEREKKKIFRNKIKFKLLKKYFKVKTKNEILKTQSGKMDYQIPPVIKRNKIFELNHYNKNDFYQKIVELTNGLNNVRQYVSRETKEFVKKHNIQHNSINKAISFVLSISKAKYSMYKEVGNRSRTHIKNLKTLDGYIKILRIMIRRTDVKDQHIKSFLDLYFKYGSLLLKHVILILCFYSRLYNQIFKIYFDDIVSF